MKSVVIVDLIKKFANKSGLMLSCCLDELLCLVMDSHESLVSQYIKFKWKTSFQLAWSEILSQLNMVIRSL